MAKKQKVTLTAPETFAEVADVQITSIELDATNLTASVHTTKRDSGGNPIRGDRFEVALGQTDVDNFIGVVVAAAQTAGSIAAGTHTQEDEQ